jgi:putative FmdB family regulatory protein
MPTYEYICTNCGHRFDVSQRIADDPPSICERCGRKTLRKVFHPAGIVFKGSGFYATDTRRKAKVESDGQKKTEDAGGKKAKKAEPKPSSGGSETSA